MICVFLDTNILHSKSTDFTKARFAEKLEELIGEIEVNDLYTYVKLVIPQLVISELRKQQIDDCSDTVKDLRKTKVTSQVIELPKNYEETCDKVFNDTLDDLHNGTVKVDVAPYPPDEALQGIIRRAISKNPPFEAKEKESDKGFKDALIWESLLEYKKQHSKDVLVLYSKDKRITDPFLAKEYKELFSEEIHMVFREDPNSHKKLLDKLRELSDVEEERATFSQQLKDRLVDLVKNISWVYLVEPDKSYELEDEEIIVNDCSVVGISITDEIEDEDITTFYLTLKVSYDYRDVYGGSGTMEAECNAMANYSLSADKFYFQGAEGPDGILYEFDGLGEEL